MTSPVSFLFTRFPRQPQLTPFLCMPLSGGCVLQGTKCRQAPQGFLFLPHKSSCPCSQPWLAASLWCERHQGQLGMNSVVGNRKHTQELWSRAGLRVGSGTHSHRDVRFLSALFTLTMTAFVLTPATSWLRTDLHNSKQLLRVPHTRNVQVLCQQHWPFSRGRQCFIASFHY